MSESTAPPDVADAALALERARSALLGQQREDGRFEGRLTSNAFPTLACILVEALDGASIESDRPL